MSEQLTIRLLGTVAIEVDGKAVSGLPSRKAEALLIYLAANKRPFAREVLADFLWDDRPQQQAQANLRSILSSLRRKLAPYLEISRHSVGFNRDSNHLIDAAAFEEAIRPLERQLAAGEAVDEVGIEALKTAVNLYQGSFLSGFHLRDSYGFEEWVSLERERLQRLAITGLRYLVQHSLSTGAYRQGIEYAARLIEFDPLNELSHRQMMLLLARSGQRNAALAQYETCRAILAAELDVPPDAETNTLYTRIHAAHATVPHNLPPQPTEFVGREAELNEVYRNLAHPDCRMLTVLGPGGMGKTRLSIQSAYQIATNQPGMFLNGIRFISLAGIPTAELMPTTIASALNLSLSGSKTPESQLLEFLQDSEMLLVIDNFEHLLGERQSVTLLTDILRQAPYVKILTTSRSRLNLHEEWVLDIQGLSFPEAGPVEDPQQFTALQLFAQNARRIQRRFEPTTADWEAIGAICRMLNGMPLGIEMAAAWVRFISCQEILEGLTQDLDFLTHTSGNVPDRHANLRAVFTYSWRLMAKGEQETLQKLSVFRGGFGREAAVSVAGASLPMLASLADHSWIRRAASDGSASLILRYEMLEVLRQYASEQLQADVVTAETEVRAEHMRYYTQFLARRRMSLQGGDQEKVLREIRVEIENIRAAWQEALVHQRLEAIKEALDGLFHFYDTQSWFLEGATVLGQAVEQLSISATEIAANKDLRLVLAKLAARRGWFLFHLGQYDESIQLLEQSLTTFRSEREQRELVFCLNYLGAITRHLGNYETATTYLQEALTVAQQIEDSFGASIALNILGQVSSLQGNYEQARDYCRRGLAIKRAIRDRWGMTYSLTYLGRVAQALGEHQEAQELFQESMSISEELGDQRGVASSLSNLGEAAQALGHFVEAQRLYSDSLTIFQDIGNRLGVAITFVQLANVAAEQADFPEAERFLRSGLQEGLAIRSRPTLLDGVLTTAVLANKMNDRPRAQTSLTFVRQFDGSSPTQKAQAEQLLAEVGSGKTAVSEQIPSLELFVQGLLFM